MLGLQVLPNWYPKSANICCMKWSFFSCLPFNLWIKFHDTVGSHISEVHQKSPEDLLKHSCWTLIESFRFSRLSGIWWSAFLTSSLVMLTLLVQGSHVKNRCSHEEYKVTGIVNWEVLGRTIFLLHLLHPVLHIWGLRAKGQASFKIQQGTWSGAEGSPCKEKGSPWRLKGLSQQQKG